MGLSSQKILVLGVGRSGTTAVYSLLQQIFDDQDPHQSDYVYEPFLWDRSTFNKSYLQITNEFHVADAVSVEGMYHHQQIPLFCDRSSEIGETSVAWLRNLFCPAADQSHSIVKMIRANGRIDLIREVQPDVKIIALLRNPLDVINSAIHRFSFFGDEFQKSDFNRFRQELCTFVKTPLSQLPSADDVVGKETAFWLAMNQHLVDRVNSNGDQVLPIVYEEFDRQREKIVDQICQFIGVETQPGYSQHARKSVGPVTRNEVHLTARQYLTVESRLDEYAQMVASLTDYDLSEQLHEARERYISSPFRQQGLTRSCRFNSLYAQSLLMKKEGQISQLQGVQERVEKLEANLQENEATIREQELHLSSKDRELAGLEQKLTAQDKTIERLQEKIFAKSLAVESKQQELAEKNSRITELQQKNESEFALTLQQGIELTSRDTTIRQQQEAIEKKDTAIRGYEREMASRSEWIAKLQGELTASSKLLLKRETEIAEKNERILEQQKSLQEMEQKHAELQSEVAAHQEELHSQQSALRAEYASTRNREHELQQSLNEKQRLLHDHQQALNQKDREVQQLRDNVAQLTDSLKRNATTRQTMETRLTELSREIRGRELQRCEQAHRHQQVIDALRSDICVRNDKLRDMNELLTGLRQFTSYPVAQFDRKLRAYRKLLETYQRVKPEWHNKKNPEVSKRRRRRLKRRIEDRGVNLGDQTEAFFGNHRSGWSFAVASLAQINNPQGIYLDTFIERTFCWSPEGVCTHKYPWIGFIHVPPFVPGWFQYKQSNQAIFQSEAWQESLPYCRGLFTLSDYHRDYLQLKFDFPVESVVHPTEIPNQLWSWDAFCDNREKRIVQLGWWLRKLHAIYQLPDSQYRKTLIRVNEKDYLTDLFRKEKDLLVSAGEFEESMYDSVDILNFVPNDQYDQLLSRNLVFLHLYDSSANNSVIECIARGTPLLINPIAPVKEYLGEDYPLYYESYEEAIEKASDMELIRQTHEYLMQCLTRKKLTGEYFKQSVQRSSLLINAYQA